MDTMHLVEHLEARRLFAAGPLDSDGLASPGPTPAGQYALQGRKLVLSDGRTIVAGDDQSHWRLRAYLPDGSIDKSFGERGYLDLSRRLASSNTRRITFLAEAPDGGLYVGGNGRVRNEKRSDATGTLVAKLKADGSLDKSFFPKGARDIDRGGFFRMDGPVGSFAFRDVLQVVRGGKLFTGNGGQSNDTMLNGAAGGNSGPSLGSTSGVGANAPASLAGTGSLPVLLPTTNGILSLADGPDGSLLGVYYLYEHDGRASPIAYLIRIGANGQIFAAKIGQGGDGTATAGSFAPIGLELGADGKLYATTHRQTTPRSVDTDGDSNAGDVAVDAAQSVTDARDGGDQCDFPSDIVTRSPRKEAHGANRDDVGAGSSRGTLTQVFRDGAALTVAALGNSGTSTTKIIGSVFGATVIDPHVLSSAGVGGALDLLPPFCERLERTTGIAEAHDGDAATHVASPIAGAHGFAWEPIDGAPYVVRLLSNRVADITGALAVGRTIGSFAVRVPDAPLLGTITAALREKRQKLAPNT
jgi:hypothetical protein